MQTNTWYSGGIPTNIWFASIQDTGGVSAPQSVMTKIISSIRSEITSKIIHPIYKD